MSEIKLVVTDVDGTMTPQREHKISPRTHEAVAMLWALDKHAAIASSRPVEMAKKVIDLLGFHGPQVIDGGATIYDFDEQKVLWKRWLELTRIQEIVAAILPYAKEIDCFPEMKMVRIEDFELAEVVEDAPYVHVEILRSDKEKVWDALSVLTEIDYSIVGWTDDLYFVQICDERATKEQGVAKLQELLCVSEEETLAIGDADNDLPLFARAAVRVAMGNATQAVGSAATHHTDTVENDGWAKAIEELVLGKTIK